MQEYKTLKPHHGDRHYSPGMTRTAMPNMVKHLVQNGTLKPMAKVKAEEAAKVRAEKAAKAKAQAEAKNKAEAEAQNKAEPATADKAN